VEHVVMIAPVDADEDKAQDVAAELWQQRGTSARSWPCGTFSSSTMIVMMMASTPSLNASSRDVLMRMHDTFNVAIRIG
jgi:hypothetical protein